MVLYYQIQFACVQIRHNPLSGGYCGEVPPLPIPNREVKLTCADGTAMQCGRVGSRLLLSRASITKVVGAFFTLLPFYFSLVSCRKVSKNDKNASKSNIFWEFMLFIVKKVLTLQLI